MAIAGTGGITTLVKILPQKRIVIVTMSAIQKEKIPAVMIGRGGKENAVTLKNIALVITVLTIVMYTGNG